MSPKPTSTTEYDKDKTKEQLLSELQELRAHVAILRDAEEGLRASKQFRKNIFDSIQDGISVLDKDLNIVQVNHVKEMWHSHMKPLAGKKCFYAFHGRKSPCEVCPSLRAMELKTPQNDTVPFRGENGKLRGWLEVFAFPIKDDEGNVTGVIEHVRDVTERKRAENELKEHRDHLEDLVMERTGQLVEANECLREEIAKRIKVQEVLNKRLVALTEPLETADISFTDLFDLDEIQKIQDSFAEAMNVASIITNPDGTPITRPSNFCRLCIDIIRKTEKGLANCYYSDSVIGRQNPEGPIIQPCLSGGLWDAGASITLGGKHIANWLIGQVKNEAIDEEKVVLYADKIGADREEFRKALQEVPVMSKERFDKIAKILFLFANELSHKAYQNIQQARFIAGRMRAERELEESKNYLDRIINSVADPIFVKDRQHMFVLVNDAFCNFIRHGRDELIGKSDYDIYPRGQAEGFWAKDELVYTAGMENISEEVLTDASGEAHVVVTKITLYTDNKGEKFIVGIIRDITDLKQAAEELKRHRDNLESLVEERTSDLKMVNEELQQEVAERKQAEEALVEAKQQAELYLDLMGHDINNMHQVALGYLELARDQPAAGEGQIAFIDKAAEVMQRSTKLISNVRKLQKFREGIFRAQDIDACRVLADLQSEYEAVSGKAITLSLNGHDRCIVHANELLHDVFANLVNNAVKHTGDGAEIKMGLDVVEDNGKPYCRVTVEDNGPGVPDGSKERIFNRMHMSSTKGMGIGLYLVKTLVNSYDGKIWVEDRVKDDHSKGARFIVMLPAIE